VNDRHPEVLHKIVNPIDILALTRAQAEVMPASRGIP
jgi:hypothetical protein